MKTTSFRDLIVWQKSYKLTLETYKVTSRFPKDELYGLTSQIRRAAVSIPSNIAEGYARQHRNEYRQFLSIAYSSLAEFETQLLLAKDLKYLELPEYSELEQLRKEVGSMLYKMINPIR